MALWNSYVKPSQSYIQRSNSFAAGAGKTKLASSVIDEHLNRATYDGLAYFYCNRGDNSRNLPEQVLNSIVRQLSLLPVPRDMWLIQEPLHKLYKKIKDEGHASDTLSYSQSEALLPKLLEAYTTTTIILDALDECDKTKRYRLIKTLKNLIRDCKNLKVFITSRRDPDINTHLQSEDTLEMSATDNENDIRLFVRSELDKVEETRGRPISLALREEIIETLHNKSNSM